MKNKKNMFYMMVIFAFSYIAFTFPYVLMMPYLQSLGYSGSEQGVIIACGSLAGMVGQMIFGYLCDKYKTVKKFVYLGQCLLVVFTWVFYYLGGHSFFLHLALGTLTQGVWLIMCGLMDSWALEVDETCSQNYGSIRAFGAIGWVVGGPIVSWVASNYGYKYMGFALMAFTLLMFAVSYWAPDAQKSEAAQKKELKFSDVVTLVKNPRYVIVVAIFLCAFLVMNFENFLAVQKIGVLAGDGSATYTSLKSSFQAAFELPFFFMGGMLLKKFGYTKLLYVALIAYLFRVTGTILSLNAMQIVYVSAMQLLTFPLLTITSKAMVDNEIPDYLRSTGQQVAFSVYNAGSALIAPLIGGAMFDALGANKALMVVLAFAIVPVVLLTIYNKMKKVEG